MKYLYTKRRFLKHIPLLPFLYGAAVLLVLLDLWVEIYHRISFPIYGKPYIKRGQYIKTDRHKLKYLNPIQKINCFYCGYANGLIHYLKKILAETEDYWCGIQHKKSDGFISPSHHKYFIRFGDESAYHSVFESKKENKF